MKDDYNDNYFHNHTTQSSNNIGSWVHQVDLDMQPTGQHHHPPDYHLVSTARMLLKSYQNIIVKIESFKASICISSITNSPQKQNPHVNKHFWTKNKGHPNKVQETFQLINTTVTTKIKSFKKFTLQFVLHQLLNFLKTTNRHVIISHRRIRPAN